MPSRLDDNWPSRATRAIMFGRTIPPMAMSIPEIRAAMADAVRRGDGDAEVSVFRVDAGLARIRLRQHDGRRAGIDEELLPAIH
jgi:hypothetical protein